MRRALLQALEDRYNAEISNADATIQIYLNNSVGIGEHPQHLEEIDKLIEKIANAQEKLEVIKSFEPEKNDYDRFIFYRCCHFNYRISYTDIREKI